MRKIKKGLVDGHMTNIGTLTILKEINSHLNYNTHNGTKLHWILKYWCAFKNYNLEICSAHNACTIFFVEGKR